MNYRHIFHAGNFADVFKHILLIGLLKNLLRKETALCYHDTHAGIGLYDLESIGAQKTKEYLQGITRVLKQKHWPSWVNDYVTVVNEYNKHALRFYPGSPLIAQHFLRAHDRMLLCELHQYDIDLLRDQFINNKQVAVHFLNGYQSLKAFLPPKEKRGVVLIDPAFEADNEFITITNAMQIAYERWPTGIYAIWYPIKQTRLCKTFTKKIATLGFKKVLCVELQTQTKISEEQLHSCGMLICNPPWQYDTELKQILPWLNEVLADDNQGNYHIEWLVNED